MNFPDFNFTSLTIDNKIKILNEINYYEIF